MAENLTPTEAAQADPNPDPIVELETPDLQQNIDVFSMPEPPKRDMLPAPQRSSVFGRLNRLTPQSVFLLVAGFFGLVLVLVTPPVQAPDEPHHWFRIYQLSQGKMLAHDFGGDIPVSLLEYQTNAYGAIPFHPENKTSAEQIRGLFKIPLEPALSRFEPFPNTALYSILPYAPQTLGLLIAVKLHWPALALLYAGRVGSILGYLLVGWAAIRITPILKWPAVLILCNPLALFLAGSVSADPITTAIAFLATAAVLHCIFSTRTIKTNIAIAVTLLMMAVALCKAVYFPLVFLVLAVPREKWGIGYRRWVIPIAMIVLTIGTFSAWSWIVQANHVVERGSILGGGPILQRQWILAHKLEYTKVLWRTVIAFFGPVVNSAVGNLGWVDTQLLQPVIDFMYIFLAWVCLAYDEPLKLRLWPRIVAAIALLVSTVFIMTANYMVWDALGAPTVEGLAGRYFLPVGLLFCMIFRRRGSYPVQPKWMLAMLSALLLYTVWVVVERYYLPVGALGHLLSGPVTASVIPPAG